MNGTGGDPNYRITTNLQSEAASNLNSDNGYRFDITRSGSIIKLKNVKHGKYVRKQIDSEWAKGSNGNNSYHEWYLEADQGVLGCGFKLKHANSLQYLALTSVPKLTNFVLTFESKAELTSDYDSAYTFYFDPV